MIRPSVLVVSVVLARFAGADELQDPAIIQVRAPEGDLTMRARRGTARVRGLGDVEDVYGYDVSRGTAFPPRPATVGLMPPVIAVDRGTTLRIRYRSELLATDVAGKRRPTVSNLHTHGLIVSPRSPRSPRSPGSLDPERVYGDCVFVLAGPTAGLRHGQGSGDPCALASGPSFMNTEPGDIRYSYVIPDDHPSGVYWFHPHPHGLSEGQVANGLAGLMLIGSFWDYAYIRCRVTASPDEAGLYACRDQEAQREERAAERRADAVKVRTLGLKDIQVAKVKGKSRFRLIEFPLRPDPSDVPGSHAFSEKTEARKSRCGDLALSESGELRYVDGIAVPGQCWQKEHPDDRWVFTVSGQVDPRITVKAGQSEAWHLANIGADVTYRLRLETVEDPPRRIAFEVRAIDGAAFPYGPVRRRTTEIVLMPGARVDVLVERCSASSASDCVEPSKTVRARLRTAGIATGIDAKSGDLWPPVDLATVVFEAGASAPGRSLPEPRPGPPSPEVPAASPAPAGPIAKPAPLRTCDHHRYRAGPADFRIDADLVRLIRFNNRDFGDPAGELFGIHTENFHMQDPAGRAIALADLVAEGRGQRRMDGQASAIASIALDDPCWKAATSGAGDPAEFASYYPAFKMDGDPNVTAAYGAREYWLLVNDSDECHNFHIHQTKFEVVDADFAATGARTPSSPCLGDRAFIPPVHRNLLHDNYPLPPRSRVLVMIKFDGPKLGRFVFHCHILEHEDKGMMATISVVE